MEHPASSVARDSDLVQRAIAVKPEDVVDVLIYVTVLNLVIEHFPGVISETFTLSLLTAVVLKVALEVVLVVKARAITRFRGATTVWGRVGAGLLLWGTAAGSKIVVLELVSLVFGDAVSLGGFLSVTLLVVALLLSRAGVRRLMSNATADADDPTDADPTEARPSSAL